MARRDGPSLGPRDARATCPAVGAGSGPVPAAPTPVGDPARVWQPEAVSGSRRSYLVGARGRIRPAAEPGRRRDAAPWQPVPPVHAVNQAGTAVCGEVHLIVVPDAGLWDHAEIPDRDRCPRCLITVDALT